MSSSHGTMFFSTLGTVGRSKGLDKVNTAQDVVELLMLICDLCCKHGQNNYKTYTIISSLLVHLMYLYQKSDMSKDVCIKELKTWVESMDDFDTCVLDKFQGLAEKKNCKIMTKLRTKPPMKIWQDAKLW